MRKTKDQKTISSLQVQIKQFQEELEDERRLYKKVIRNISEMEIEIITLKEHIANYQEAIVILGRSSRMNRIPQDFSGNYMMAETKMEDRPKNAKKI